MKIIVLAALAALWTMPALGADTGASAGGALSELIALGTADVDPGIATSDQATPRAPSGPARPDK